MTSALQVETIQNSAGVAVIDTFPEVDFWQLDEDHLGGGVLQSWARVGIEASGISIGNMPIGSGMICSNDGVFTFPRRGLYKIDVVAIMKIFADDSDESLNFDVSRDGGSSFLSMYRIDMGSLTSSSEYHTVSVPQFLNVTSTDDIKIRLRAEDTTESTTVFMSANSSEYEHLSFNNLETTILFNKVAPVVSS
tara:strand:+ start:495 stop:1073 length:579 start_codon:yes stop_codon:yes gene_type:complete